MKKDFSNNTFVLFAISLVLGFGIFTSLENKKNDKIIKGPITNGQISMPVVQDSSPHTASFVFGPPVENREAEYRNYLAASVKIAVSGGSGSGTIVYYDDSSGYAYVASCGHLWSGTASAEEVKRNPIQCRIIAWYHNDEKLAQPKEYSAEVLFWSNNRGYDSSLVRFKPDWIPNYFPIAPVDYQIPMGSTQNSCGCDGGREVARYAVEIVEYRGMDLITKNNSPRPGRSGGGMMDEHYYIATCWGTSNENGSGIGYFTPLKSIHSVYTSNGYDWLLNISKYWARDLPIKDINNNDKTFPRDFIPVPGKNYIPLPRF